MKFLLLIAHGSRRQGANEEIARLAETIAARADNGYDGVVPAFLEIAEPNIHQGIKHCVELGADHIVVMPYFLAAGNHVNKDIPGEIACAQVGAPDVKIEMAQYLGANEAMAGLVLDCSRRLD
jgi:sirohydrochlorin ferrochelatase